MGIVGVFSSVDRLPTWVESDATVAVVRVAVDFELSPNIALARRPAEEPVPAR